MKKRTWKEFGDDLAPQSNEFTLQSQLKAEMKVRVQKSRGGKGGKTVTEITGLNIQESEITKLLKTLKAHLGTGGTVKGGILELQGDQIFGVMKILKEQGFSPKQAGG